MTADARRRAEEALATMNGVLLAWGPQPPMSKSAALCHAISVGTVALEALLASEPAKGAEDGRITHHAATGSVTGPIRGVVEDVADISARLAAAESRAARLLTAMREIECKTGHFGEAPPLPEWMPMLSLIAWVGRTARAALAAEEGK